MQEEPLRDLLKRYMETNHLTQKDIADAVNISQASVSRALKRSPRRQGKANAKIFTYIQQALQADFRLEGRERVMEAFQAVWDGSPEHAIAIARIIEASDGLLPAKRLQETD